MDKRIFLIGFSYSHPAEASVRRLPPFKNQSGIVGIISLQLQADFINTLIQDISDETGVNIFVMDTNGVILAHSDESSLI